MQRYPHPISAATTRVMRGNFRRDTKQEVYDQIRWRLGMPRELLGPGGKEHKPTLEQVAARFELPTSTNDTKHGLAAHVAAQAGLPWEARFESTGQTITVEGLHRILE